MYVCIIENFIYVFPKKYQILLHFVNVAFCRALVKLDKTCIFVHFYAK
jgi:hypothetical protein